MNGVHDMGGMHDMGPIQYEKNEPVFHEHVGVRVFALIRAMRAWQKWNSDALRHQRELIPAGRIPAHELLREMDRSAGRAPGQDQSCHAR